MLAVLCALKCWQNEANVHRVVLFTDREAVRGAFLKSWSANTDSGRLLDTIFGIEAGFHLPVWIDRVPSQSNLADALSREVVTVLGSATKAEVDPWEVWNLTAKKLTGTVTPPKAFTGEKARLWGERSPPFPQCQKESDCVACFLS